MGFWPFKKNKFNKLTREEVVDSICQLEKQLASIEAEIASFQEKTDALMAKGRAEKNPQTRLLYAKKINMLKAEHQQNIQRCMYLMYNIQLMNKLKAAIDDNQFFQTSSQNSLGNLLADQKGLAAFLNKTLNTKVAAEDVLTAADDMFKEIESAYDPNQAIYGMNNQDDELLAMFEKQDEAEGAMESFEQAPEAKPQAQE